VGVGDEVAVARDDESGADRLLVEFALRRTAPRDLPEAAEELVERIVLGQLREARAPDLLCDIDADDGRAMLFVELGKVGKAGRAALGGGGNATTA
jgi:hypothetical protein